MNFVQIADVHFDIPFTTISDRADLGKERRLEQRKAFNDVINYIKENNVENLFICGDLYEQEYIRESTINYINNLFKEIPKTKVYIVPGNHDPYIKNSYYEKYNWADNVYIFKETVEIIENNEFDIYGFGFNNFEMNLNQINNISIKNKNKINILISHGDIYSESKYNYMNLKYLNSIGFDYIALGHIHKRDDYYSGSLISLGFDEPGEHGFIYGEIINNKINKKFIKIDEREFKEIDLDISNINSEEELIEKINSINDDFNLIKINLIGEKNFYLNIDLKIINKNIIKIKDKTKIKKILLENNNNLSGIFINKLNNKLNNKEITENEYEKIIELATKIMEK